MIGIKLDLGREGVKESTRVRLALFGVWEKERLTTKGSLVDEDTTVCTSTGDEEKLKR